MTTLFRTTYLLITLLFFCSSNLAAQRKAFQKARFGSSVFAGINASQIAGDGHQGYHYAGLTAGLRGTAYINWRMDMSVSLSYARRGAKPPLGFSVSRTSVPWQQNTIIRLDYAALGYWIHAHLYPHRASLSRLTAHLGLLYGYAFDINIRQNTDNNPENDYPPLLPFMSRHDLSLQAGLSYYFSPKFSFRLLHSLQLIPLYKTGQIAGNKVPTLRQYHLQLGFEYIIAPDQKLLKQRRTPPWSY